MSTELECPHISKAKTVYIYDINSDVTIHLCEICNMNLAGEISKQIAIDTFFKGVKEND